MASRRKMSGGEAFRRMPASALKILDYGQWPAQLKDRIHGRRSSKKKIVAGLSERQNHRCCYCGKKTWMFYHGETGPHYDQATREHIIPVSRGGRDHDENTVMCCRACNETRWTGNAMVFHYEMFGHFDGWELEPIEPVRITLGVLLYGESLPLASTAGA